MNVVRAIGCPKSKLVSPTSDKNRLTKLEPVKKIAVLRHSVCIICICSV